MQAAGTTAKGEGEKTRRALLAGRDRHTPCLNARDGIPSQHCPCPECSTRPSISPVSPS